MTLKNKALFVFFISLGVLGIFGTVICGYFVYDFNHRKILALNKTVEIFHQIPKTIFDLPDFTRNLLKLRTPNFQLETFIPSLSTKSIVLNNYPFSFLKPNSLIDILDSSKEGFSGYNPVGIYGEFLIAKDDGGRSLLRARNLLLDFNSYCENVLKNLSGKYIENLSDTTKKQIEEFMKIQSQQPQFEELYQFSEHASYYFVYAIIFCAFCSWILLASSVSVYISQHNMKLQSAEILEVKNERRLLNEIRS